MRRFLLDILHHQGHVTPGEKMARRVGRAFENARNAETPEAVTEAIEEVVARFDQAEQPVVRERVVQLLERAAEIDEEIEEETEDENVVSEKQVQFYAQLANGWRLAAKPDEVQYLQDADYGAMIRVQEEKTKGRYTSHLKALMYFFGMVISLEMKERADAADAEAWAKYRQEMDAWERRPRHRSAPWPQRPQKPRRQPPMAIQLAPLLAGKVMNEAGELVPAPQPDSFMYSRRCEQDQVNHAVRMTEKIEAAFAANEFPATTGGHCHKCFFRNDCEAYLKMSPRAVAATPADEVSSTVVQLPILQSAAG